jgi:hypothetical protein
MRKAGKQDEENGGGKAWTLAVCPTAFISCLPAFLMKLRTISFE